MIIFPPIITDFLMSFVSIAYGMRWENHYTPWISVVLNVVFTFIFLSSNDLPMLVILILLSYVFIGILVAWKGVGLLYAFFGTKTFGALTLTSSLNILHLLGWMGFIQSFVFGSADSTAPFLLSWVFIGLLTHLFGWILFGRKDKTTRKKH